MRAHAVKGGDLQKKNAPAKNARSGEGASGAENALQRMSDESASAMQLREMSDLASTAGPLAELAALQGAEGMDTAQRAAMEEEMPAQGKFIGSRGDALQRAAMEEEPVQGRFTPDADTTQRAAMEEEMPAQGKFIGSKGDAIQRAAMEEEPVQGLFASGKDTAQRAAMEEELPAQGKFIGSKGDAIQRAAMEEEPVQGRFEAGHAPVQRKSDDGGQGKLPDTLKSGVESLSGQSLDDVNVHYNSPEPKQLSAHAFAQGSDIHVASGQEKHLPHEAWHVAQQKQGRVKPTVSMNGGVPVNDDPKLEREADVMGAKSLSKGAEAVQKKPMEEE